MNRSTWKASERRMAALLGGTRVPVTGRGRGDAPDIDHDTFAIEHKAGRVLGPRLLKAIDQAHAAAAKAKKTPLVTIDHSTGPGRPNKTYVLLEVADFLRLLALQSG